MSVSTSYAAQVIAAGLGVHKYGEVPAPRPPRGGGLTDLEVANKGLFILWMFQALYTFWAVQVCAAEVPVL